MTVWDAVLDATVVRSFDARGFRRHAARFRASDTEVDLAGRVYLVTGANSGIGFAAARALAERRARVHLLCRSAERGAEAQARIRAATPAADVRVAVVDCALVGSVNRFVAGLAEERIDGLILNAGVLPAERSETSEGVELTFATNVLGGFFLLRALVPRLARARGRVIHVASGGMYPTRLELDDWQWTRRRFDGVRAYAMTKRAQVVLTALWHERLAALGTEIEVQAMHPGWVDTPAVATSLPRFYRSRKATLRTPEQGADTIVWLAIAPTGTGPGGGFWFDRARKDPYALPFTRESAAERLALWELCETLCERVLAVAPTQLPGGVGA